MQNELKVFAGESNPQLAKAICDELRIPLSPSESIRFANDNRLVRVLENVREKDVFVLQTGCPPVDASLVELLIMTDALHHASARRITAIMPYYHYVRSDKKDEPRIAITARLVADLLDVAGASRVLTMNLHSPQIQGFFRIPVDQLSAAPIICDYFAREDMSNAVAVAPDAGSAKRAGVYAERLNMPLAVADKRRVGHKDESEIVRIVGDVEGKHVVIFDDEIATGGSMLELADFLLGCSVKSIRAAASHGVFCGDAARNLQDSPIEDIVVTDTIPLTPEKQEQAPKIKVLSVAALFARAIENIHTGESISALFT
ncbi:MAG: ribose-phosphate pyrophosphokinase [Armatimonadota bacterium]|jgi:ribose-phosphate pyrophosphokinase